MPFKEIFSFSGHIIIIIVFISFAYYGKWRVGGGYTFLFSPQGPQYIRVIVQIEHFSSFKHGLQNICDDLIVHKFLFKFLMGTPFGHPFSASKHNFQASTSLTTRDDKIHSFLSDVWNIHAYHLCICFQFCNCYETGLCLSLTWSNDSRKTKLRIRSRFHHLSFRKCKA